MRIYVMLQNAWSYRGGDSWEYDSWVWALSRCRTGERLSKLLGDDCYRSIDITYGNTTPKVGTESTSRLPPDEQYVIKNLLTRSPHVVVACGLQAEKVIKKLWRGPYLCMPHPASRVLTNALLTQAKTLLYGSLPYCRRLTLRQQRGSVAVEEERLQPEWFKNPIFNQNG